MQKVIATAPVIDITETAWMVGLNSTKLGFSRLLASMRSVTWAVSE